MNNNEYINQIQNSPVADVQNFAEPNYDNNAKNQNNESETYKEQVQMMLAQEFFNIEKMLREGKITQDQVAALTNQSIEKAKELLLNKQDSRINKNALDTTDFFNKNGRLEVLNYLKGLGTNFDNDEVNQITKLVETVEQNAVKNYLDNLRHGENFERENAEAKQKLNTIAQNATTASPYQRLFTRADIGKMSTAEFLKNEKLIMDQLKKGQIK